MAVGVAFGKTLVGQVFNKYTDKFERGMSGFNRFISTNMAAFTVPIDYPSIMVTEGKLWAPQTVSAVKMMTDLKISWTAANIGNNGAATDKIYGVAYNKTTGLWYFAAAEVARSAAEIHLVVPTGDTDTDFQCYCWAAKYSATSPTLLEMISDSVYSQGT
jgi:hypothetical protein